MGEVLRIIRTIDWYVVVIYIGLVMVYLLTSFLGVFLFPPMISCLMLTYGDLETCSLGMWSNEYQEDNYYSSYYNSYDPEPYQGEQPIYPWRYECS